uniref:Carbonic anhydrase n=1 Tax=Coccomyxa sp. PA TaxID=41892 RepID=Q96554_9CHLO|nr:Chain A, Carbonic anhydrase [Coccomyxa sp. PA]3UCJ_B Chain B, Carbonic anhydrase [Coccomyxa sp. PA]3UCK_A Chain A, Carbonic anhydrase [Coccomyxa sp. PA]3UCK_B Chain B, Carbonic anhydrase [Coccomyxa sp. PA]3UCM_A Chain A, Carbonic anhydrase [Coccomyxa sp. PA]3UCM_B Chain B, Carbonic anhydrase [Coccomyxa sp. PA]3UCN_A Chain A, Carbonic anhydrase [Coccomyxa sp. PA]3UCN_B Chain B, Carbonic anhydrase [Coccomyxa sp. PA]3UCO_A Chain A, Carbonic anhydrase [Coccomyxa sp. PA]3UCO_B Chain B, Carbo
MSAKDTADLSPLLEANRKWADECAAKDSTYFSKVAGSQAPEYLYIGCADSRVSPAQLFNMAPGEVFVQRNVGNLVSNKDLNCMSCLEYTVDHLKIKHILVCGHYNCGACKAGLVWHPKTAGVTNLWISDVREVRDKNAAKLHGLSADDAWDKMVELNVEAQVFNVCASPIVQAAWARGQPLSVHGIVYTPGTGLVKELIKPITGMEDAGALLRADLKQHCFFSESLA